MTIYIKYCIKETTDGTEERKEIIGPPLLHKKKPTLKINIIF